MKQKQNFGLPGLEVGLELLPIASVKPVRDERCSVTLTSASSSLIYSNGLVPLSTVFTAGARVEVVLVVVWGKGCFLGLPLGRLGGGKGVRGGELEA